MIGDIFKSSGKKKGEKYDRSMLITLLENNTFSLEENERILLLNALDVQNRIAREIMIPRIDMITVGVNDTFDKVLQSVKKHGHSRLPLIGEDADAVIGVIYVKDLLHLDKKGKKLDKLCHDAYFIPETKPVIDLLEDFKSKRIHMAIVADEYGGVSGLVSMEDILEMLVGDIQDEYDNEAEQIVKVRKNIYNIDARISIDELNNQIGSLLPEDIVDTLGGLFMELFGSVPERNDHIFHDGYKLRVLQVADNRINRLQLTLPSPTAEKNKKD